MLYDHINAEIASETLTTKRMCIEYIKWTYFFKRLVKNPTYYGLATSTNAAILNDYLTNLINNVLTKLNESGCIKIHDNGDIESTSIGNLASFYYISHKTAKVFFTLIKPNLTIYDLIPIISCAEEFADLPVRHNEDLMNKELHKNLPYQYENINYGGSHDKTNLLFQAHFSRISMPVSDYDTDLKLVLDNSIRILLFMADIAYQKKILDTTLKILTMIQMVMQGLWHDDSSLYSLPYLDESDVCSIMNKGNVSSLCELCEKANNKEDIEMFLKKKCELTRLKSDEANQICELLKKYPLLDVKFKVFAGNTKTMERIYDRPINANEDCHIRINITRRNYNANDSKGNLVIHAKYPKIKSCRWFIVIGNESTNEILAFEKVSFKEKITKNIVFTTPCVIDDNSLQVYIISDSYFGIDQQYSIRLQSINNMIIRKCGLVEIKEIEKDIKDIKDKDDYEDDYSDDDDVETQNEENEDIYIP
jgi:activating signal cointegrator complex subunit 3